MTKPFLIIQLRPEDETADNELAAIMNYGGLKPDEVSRVRAEQQGLPEINLAQFAGIIIGGSPFDVTTEQLEKSAIQVLLEQQFASLFEQIIELDFPFLGCCSGNGLLGNYLQTPMSRRYAEPVCCRQVTITDAGQEDPLLAGFPQQIPVLLGHKEACDEVPDGAVLLIQGKHCPVQMFRVKQNIYATQFHPEGDPAGFALRINIYQDHGYFEPTQAQTLIADLAEVETPHSQEILRRFVARYR